MNICNDLIKGKFLKECKNRFICEVLVDNNVIECYVPSSSKLINYISLKGKEVLLAVNKSKKTRTQYSLFAVKYYKNYILLNLNVANHIVEEYLRNNFNYKTLWREKKIGNYKADFILEDENGLLIVEAKGLISTSKEIIFPSVFSERAINQLVILETLLEQGYRGVYFYVSLSPTITKVQINSSDIEYSLLLQKCINSGMKIVGLRGYISGEKIKIFDDLAIIHNNYAN